MYTPSPHDIAKVEKHFTYHRPGGDQPERYTTLRAYAREMAMQMLKLVPDSQERDIAILKLEESIFWANAAIARNEQWAEPTPVEPLPFGQPTLANFVEEAKPAPQVVKVEPFEAAGGDKRTGLSELMYGVGGSGEPVPGGTAAQEKFELTHGLDKPADPPASASSPLSE